MNLNNKVWLDAGHSVDLTRAAVEASKNFMETARRLPVLWELTSEWNGLLNKAEDPNADPDEIQLELERIAGDIRTKAYGVAVVIKKLEQMAEWEKSEAKRLSDKAKADQGHADRLRAYALNCMNAIEQSRIETGTFTLSIRQNPVHVEVLNEPVLTRVEAYETMPDVPPQFVRLITLYKLDKVGLKDWVKTTGEVVPGVELVRTESLSIR